MDSSICDDINNNAEAIVITDINYELRSLSNIVYDIIDDDNKRKEVIKRNKVKGLYSDLYAIRLHRNCIINDPNVSLVVDSIFKKEEIGSITELDRVFLNSYYRRLLRAKLERDYIGKELVSGAVITKYENHETDAILAKIMLLLRVICNFLGIVSTTHHGTFPKSKLYMTILWASVSEKCVSLFGEDRIQIVESDDSLPANNVEAVFMQQGQEQIRATQTLMMLNIIFNSWSGSTLVINDDIVCVIPATYISRMLPKLI